MQNCDAPATAASMAAVHTLAVELANVASYGALWLIQFVLCDKVLFRTPAVAAVLPDPWASSVTSTQRVPV
jgi:hypothetical protein